MIVVSLAGGLANRMFQYAFYLSLKEVRDDVFVDESSFRPSWSFEKISLKETFPQIETPTCDLSKFWIQTKKGKIYSAIRNLLEATTKKYCYQKDQVFYPNIYKNIPKDCYFRGYWQSEKYFENVADKVRCSFEFQPFDEEKNIDISCKMQSENSVAIHVRKGKDYFVNGGITAGTCTEDYYKKAIDYITEHVNNPIFYVFTDNPDWVKDNILLPNYTLVDWNPVSGNKNFRDIQLMSNCKHNIIANSSFSWWGAWLGRNIDKIVIGPKIWYNPKIKPIYSDILCNSWIAL